MTHYRDLREAGLYDPDPEVRAKAERKLARLAAADEPTEVGVSAVTKEEADAQAEKDQKS
jgi:hypothetical protein